MEWLEAAKSQMKLTSLPITKATGKKESKMQVEPAQNKASLKGNKNSNSAKTMD
jgi:hypothetical protein